MARVQVDVDVDILRSYCILKDRIGGLADRLEKISSNSIKDDLQSVVDTLEVVTAEPASPDWANHEYIAIVSDLVASSTEDIVAGIENSELMPDEAQPIIDDARNIRERAEQLRKASEKNYSV